MEPFRIPPSLRDLIDAYPETRVILEIAGTDEQAREALVHLWLSEGTPHAFQKCPAIYDSVRRWISTCLGNLNVHAKDIGMVGSARLGASFVPKKLGRPFSRNSDLDMFIISKRLFEVLREEFNQWLEAFNNEEVSPVPGDNDKWWEHNSVVVPKNIGNGFVDVRKIPNSVLTAEGTTRHYQMAKTINSKMEELPRKLECTIDAPRPREASVRCYASWESFVRQNSLNLQHCSNDMQKHRF